jgi:hypothetical protein
MQNFTQKMRSEILKILPEAQNRRKVLLIFLGTVERMMGLGDFREGLIVLQTWLQRGNEAPQ